MHSNSHDFIIQCFNSIFLSSYSWLHICFFYWIPGKTVFYQIPFLEWIQPPLFCFILWSFDFVIYLLFIGTGEIAMIIKSQSEMNISSWRFHVTFKKQIINTWKLPLHFSLESDHSSLCLVHVSSISKLYQDYIRSISGLIFGWIQEQRKRSH